MNEVFKRTVTGIVLLIGFGGAYLHSPLLFVFVIGIILGIILMAEWPMLMPHTFSPWWMLTPFFPILPMSMLMWLTLLFHGSDFYLPLYPIIIAWTADTAGYVFGKFFGKHKMCPNISPNKTWEGFAGSIIAVFCMHMYLAPKILIIQRAYAAHPIILNLLATAIFTGVSFLGGLLLSFLKRKNKLKDAGAILPGHGGFLDRFDGVMAATLLTGLLVKLSQLL